MGDVLPYVDLGTDQLAVSLSVSTHVCATLRGGLLKVLFCLLVFIVDHEPALNLTNVYRIFFLSFISFSAGGRMKMGNLVCVIRRRAAITPEKWATSCHSWT